MHTRRVYMHIQRGLCVGVITYVRKHLSLLPVFGSSSAAD